MNKKENISMIIRECWRCFLILLLVSTAAVACGMKTTKEVMDYNLRCEWNAHTVLTDYNDLACQVKS